MGSIVTKDVEPYTIVAGNPARVLRKRFKEDIIDALLRSSWWDFSDEKLRSYAKYFQDPELFIELERLTAAWRDSKSIISGKAL